jgi:hypothetical protein
MRKEMNKFNCQEQGIFYRIYTSTKSGDLYINLFAAAAVKTPNKLT